MKSTVSINVGEVLRAYCALELRPVLRSYTKIETWLLLEIPLHASSRWSVYYRV